MNTKSILGRNNFFKPNGLLQISDDIYESRTEGYFIVFEEDADYKLVSKTFEFLKKNKVYDVYGSEYLFDDPSAELLDNEVLLFKEILVAYAKLNKNQIEQIDGITRDFKIDTEGLLNLVYPKDSFDPTDPFLPPDRLKVPINWGIKKLGIEKSNLNGEGVKVAILDTGFDLNHPQFGNRKIQYQYFVENNAMDYNGHGTMCTGIACGNTDKNGVRYGVANKSEILIGKVLNSMGVGKQVDLLKGIFWALKLKSQVISISYQEEHYCKNGDYNLIYERAFKFAQKNNSIVVLPSGNDSSRPGSIKKLSSPGNCPSALTVSAINYKEDICEFANTSAKHKTIDYVAPGQAIYTSNFTGINPNIHNTMSRGTSMAVPFISGILALLWQESNSNKVNAILNQLSQSNIYLPTKWKKNDFGKGFPRI